MLSYSLKVCMALIQNRQFRNTVLRVLTKLYMNLDTADYINVCQVRLCHHASSCSVAVRIIASLFFVLLGLILKA